MVSSTSEEIQSCHVTLFAFILKEVSAWGNILAVSMVILGSVFSAGCIYDGLVVSDQDSFSRGLSRDGTIHSAQRLPVSGVGFQIPTRWSDRGLNFGVDEIVSVVAATGRSLVMHDPDLVLGVGDLSREFGGRSQWHRSHQTGRDMDLLFFVKDKSGRRIVNEIMHNHFSDGKQRVNGPGDAQVFFDFEANWWLVAALLNNPVADIQYIFILDGLRQGLLEWAIAHSESEELIQRAAAILKQPGDSAPHDDHMHVRIYCPNGDTQFGCADFGRMRWHKRDLKYERRAERQHAFDAMVPEIVISPQIWLSR